MQLVRASAHIKDAGNALFQAGQYRAACKKYTIALRCVCALCVDVCARLLCCLLWPRSWARVPRE